jgi:hypothetical protein
LKAIVGMTSFNEYVIIALLAAILLLHIFNTKPMREGFQAIPPTGTISFDPANVVATPNTCIITYAIKEQIVKSLNNATLINDKETMDTLTNSLSNIDRQISIIGC